MKTFKIQITEQTLVGKSEREVKIKARDVESAERKLYQLCGNRDWWFKTDFVEVRK